MEGQTFSFTYKAGRDDGFIPSTDQFSIPGISKIQMARWDKLTEEQQYQIIANRPKPDVKRYNPDMIPDAKEYYAETAYRGSVQYPTERKQSDVLGQTREQAEKIKYPKLELRIATPVPYCEEYLGRFNFSPHRYKIFRKKNWTLWPFQDSVYEKKREKAESFYRQYISAGFVSSKLDYNLCVAELFIIVGVILYFAYGNTLTAINLHSWSYFNKFVVLLLTVYCGIFYLCDLARHFLPKYENSVIYLDRQKGMLIRQSQKNKTSEVKLYEYNFSDFYQRLMRERKKDFIYVGFSNRNVIGSFNRVQTRQLFDGYLNYYLLCHFMDIERPLPDLPEFEELRHLDPVTAEHDRLTNRPPRYWRDKSYFELRRLKKESRKRAIQVFTKAMAAYNV